jgi:hypothetical protein
MPGEGIFYALISAVCTDLHGPIEGPDLLSCDGGFLQFFREQMRSFMTYSDRRLKYLGLMERMAVWCSWMWCPKLILCSAMADLIHMF